VPGRDRISRRIGKTGRGERRRKMFSMTGTIRTLAVLLAMFVPIAATAKLVENITVTESGYTRENAMKNAMQAAVQTVLDRYVARNAADQNTRLIDQILDNSDRYVNSIVIIDEQMDEDDIVEITAEAAVDTDKIMTTLRNLDIVLKVPGISETFVWRVR
jgi:hypothetical protein